MTRRLLLAALAVIFMAAPAQGKKLPKEVKMSKATLEDKIRGAWAGQVIGCTFGGPTEFKYDNLIHPNYDIPWNEHIIKWWYDNTPGLYDDVYMDLTFVDVFAKEGLDAPIESFAKAFAYADYKLWHANLQARYNIVQGIMPPQSGYWEENPHADDIDFQIEADYAGIMAPGMVNAASYYCDGIGHMMNYGDGWYGGVYMAAMYALAFVSNDIEFVVEEALKTIPAQSKFHRAMSDVIKWYRQYPEDWALTWGLVQKNYNYDIGCPSCVYHHNNIDALINSAYVIIGLLYGQKDYTKTLDISTRCGQDSDCNPASAAGILGTMLGFNGIPEYWRKPLYEVEDVDFKYTTISVKKATALSLDQALQVVERNGGKVDGDMVTIKVQKPEAVRFEESFAGHFPGKEISIRKYVNKVGAVKFHGKGIAIMYKFSLPKDYQEHGYEAEVEIYLDGQYSRTMKLPTDRKAQAQEIYYKYNLEMKDHAVTFKWLNPEKDVNIILTGAVPYLDHVQLTRYE